LCGHFHRVSAFGSSPSTWTRAANAINEQIWFQIKMAGNRSDREIGRNVSSWQFNSLTILSALGKLGQLPKFCRKMTKSKIQAARLYGGIQCLKLKI